MSPEHNALSAMARLRNDRVSYDTDPKQAAETRVLGMLAANKTAVMSYHYALPGYGHIAKTGDGFHYYPEPMNMLL